MAEETAPDAGGNPLLRLSLRTKALVVANEYTHRQMEPNELARVLAALAPTAEERAQVARAVEEELRAARYPLSEVVRLMGELIPKDGEPPAQPEPEPTPEPEPGQEPAPQAAPQAATQPTPQPTPQPAPEPAKADVPAPAASAPDAAPVQGAGPPAIEPHPSVAPANEQVLITRKVRTPHLMPFERYEFQAPEAGAPEPPPQVRGAPGAPPPEPPPPTQKMPAADPANPAAALDAWAQDRAPAGPAGPAPEAKGAAPQPSGFSIDKFRGLAKPGADAGGPKPVVLVADDDARARVMYRMKLEQSGFAVREAKDGIDAWKQIKTGAIQYIVTDMKMPGYHGLEILGRMLDAGMSTPVVVVSAFDQLENEFVVSTYPKLKFLPKPASPESVAAAVGAFAREAGKQGS
ncbi:MAG: response regulator [Planctomycetota bacterium]|jgi:CheY-like chemotaxis protein